MRINDTFGKLRSRLYDNMGRIGATIAYTGAIGGGGPALYFAMKGKSVLEKYGINSEQADALGRQIAYGMSVPLVIVSFGHWISAIKELITLGKRATALDYAGAFLRISALSSPIIAFMREGDWISSAVVPSVAVLVGHGLRHISRLRSWYYSKNSKNGELI